ncbi:MAG: hypothetical protein QXZ44_00710 [Ferroplasma sp.]
MRIKKHNSHIKAIISIFAVAILLSTMGVPIYNGIYALENSAMLYEMGTAFSTGNIATSSGHKGDLIYFKIFHFGQFPSSSDLEHIFVHRLILVGLEPIVGVFTGAWAAFYSVFAFTVISDGIILSSLSEGISYGLVAIGASIDPTTLAVTLAPLVAA